jgi:type I restriction enzyme M protein
VLTNHKEAHRKGKVQLIDARNHWVPMEKSLGNKRRRIGDPSDRLKDPDHISDITALHGQMARDATRWVLFDKDGKVADLKAAAPTAPGAAGQTWKELIISKVFDNEDFGYHKVTVERPLRLNFHAIPDRSARLEDESAFKNLAASSKKDEAARLLDVTAGEVRQQQIRDLLVEFAKRHPEQINDRKVFLERLKPIDRELGVRLAAAELKAVVNALGERDESAEICRNRDGEAEPDAELRDTENVPLKENIQAYFEREVLPHVPDAWIDHSKTKIGYEIPLNWHFYRYEPPRELAVIECEIKTLEADIIRLLGEVAA